MCHYGHQLIDGFNRSYYVYDNLSIKNYCYISMNNSDDPFSLYKLINFHGANVKRITKNTQFKKLIIPEPCVNIDLFYSDKYLEFYERLSHNIEPSSCKKIYLSRTQFNPQHTSTIGEIDIENTLRENDFTIIYPEKENLNTLISLLKGADIIAGVSGTNLHNILFAKNNIKTFEFLRHSLFTNVQILINKMKNIDTFHIESFYEILPFDEVHAVPFFIKPTKYLYNFFDDNGIKYDKNKMNNNFYIDFFNYFYHISQNTYIHSKFHNLDMNIFIKNLQELFSSLDDSNIFYSKSSKLCISKKLINDIIWWIPIKKIRNILRSKFLD